ncbi:hypothetical protein DYH09_01420 [bacterium CPR1]|nr:hypothetical protein [bacterium CPR1]
MLLLLPALADDARSLATMKKAYAAVLASEKKALTVKKPAGTSPSEIAQIERDDVFLEGLKKELSQVQKGLGPEPDKQELKVVHSKLRDLIGCELDWMSREQNYLAIGPKGGPEAVRRSADQAYAEYKTLRDELAPQLKK